MNLIFFTFILLIHHIFFLIGALKHFDRLTRLFQFNIILVTIFKNIILGIVSKNIDHWAHQFLKLGNSMFPFLLPFLYFFKSLLFLTIRSFRKWGNYIDKSSLFLSWFQNCLIFNYTLFYLLIHLTLYF